MTAATAAAAFIGVTITVVALIITNHFCVCGLCLSLCVTCVSVTESRYLIARRLLFLRTKRQRFLVTYSRPNSGTYLLYVGIIVVILREKIRPYSHVSTYDARTKTISNK